MEDMTKTYYTLGRSGLRVSRLCLGTATFGEKNVGSDETVSQAILDRYLEAGGNFIDTSDNYSDGECESIIGRILSSRNLRDSLVIGTKFTMNPDPNNPSLGGNGRKHIMTACELSLSRLKTDYIDLYWLYLWDTVTPVEEVVNTLTDMVRSGKIRYYGLSNVPAWYAARAFSYAQQAGKEPPIAMQLEYSLVERHIENEHIPAAQAFGMGICAWSPLSGGFLSGKYKRKEDGFSGEGRLATFQQYASDFLPVYADREWHILDCVYEIAQSIDKAPASIALQWLLHQRGVTCVNIGATSPSQLEENLSAVTFELSETELDKLTEASMLPLPYPYKIFAQQFQATVNGGDRIVHPWQAQGV